MPGGRRQRWWARIQAWARPRGPESLPVTLLRNRVYVLPTRFGLFLALLIAAMGMGALNYNNNPALLLALMLAGAAFASLLFGHLQLSGLTIGTLSAEPVAAGESLMALLTVNASDGRVRHGLRVGHRDVMTTLSLEGATGAAVVAVPTTTRGWLDLERIRISTTRPLGLARAWAWVWPAHPLLVYPAPEVAGPPLPDDVSDARRTRINPAGDDVHQLRNYRRGDAKRAIAWKPSARRDTLLTREYEQSTGADVILDWRGLAQLPYELRIRRLAHWIDQAERENRRYELRIPGQTAIGPAQGVIHRHTCLRTLALMPHADVA